LFNHIAISLILAMEMVTATRKAIKTICYFANTLYSSKLYAMNLENCLTTRTRRMKLH